MPPTSANRPDHKLAPVRRECLFLMLLLNVLLLFCCDSFLLLFCYYFLLFCWWFHIVIFIIILFLLKNLCSSELIKDGNKERLRQLVPPTHRCFYLALQNRQLMQNMAAGPPPPHGRFGRQYLALLHSRCHLSFLKHFVKIRFWQTVV